MKIVIGIFTEENDPGMFTATLLIHTMIMHMKKKSGLICVSPAISYYLIIIVFALNGGERTSHTG